MATLKSGKPHAAWAVVTDGEVESVHPSREQAAQAASAQSRTLEYQTSPEQPDCLFLISTLGERGWQLAGEWPREEPRWSKPPQRIRLEHFQLEGDAFHRVRQLEFPWRSGLCGKMDPSASEDDLRALAESLATPAASWRPKLTLKPIQDNVPEPEKGSKAAPEAAPKATEPPVPSSEPQPAQKPDSRESVPISPPKARLTLAKGSGLFSRRNAPAPIPAFKTDPNAAGPAVDFDTRRAQQPIDEAQEREARFVPIHLREDAEGDFDLPHGHTLIRLLALTGVVLCWVIGLFLALRKDSGELGDLGQILSLQTADVVTIEPDRVFFRLPVEPSQQMRWARNLKLQPIESGREFRLPTLHLLRSWEKPDTFIRAPFSIVEVTDWWDSPLHRQVVSRGYYREWPDGSLLILDLSSDQLIGWARVHQLAEVMN